ncbi:MAG: cation transporting ATPase C-terminal domain-containing protein, partial [Betaproteobacteria bacterium]
YLFALHSGLDEKKAGTLFFATLVFARLVNGLICRSLTQSVFRINLFSNKALLGSIFVTVVCVITMINLPLFHNVFGLVTLDRNEWMIVTLAPLVLLVFSELFKLTKRLRLR